MIDAHEAKKLVSEAREESYRIAREILVPHMIEVIEYSVISACKRQDNCINVTLNDNWYKENIRDRHAYFHVIDMIKATLAKLGYRYSFPNGNGSIQVHWDE